MSLVQRLSEQLQQSLDANYKVKNVEAVLEVIKQLEGIPITKEQLETTRLAKFINGLRRQTTDDNLARRSKNLLRRWRDSVMPALAPASTIHQAYSQHTQNLNIASNSGSYFVNNHNSSIQHNGISSLAQPPGNTYKQPTTLTISSASSSPLMQHQQKQQQQGAAPSNRPYNGRSSIVDTNQAPSLDQHSVMAHMATQSSNFTAAAGVAIKQRQNQPTMNCDTNSTNSFLLSNNTTSDLSDNSQQCGNTSAITPSRRSKSSKKEKKSKKNNNKEVISGNNNNNFPSTFGGVISGNLTGNTISQPQKPQLINNKLINDDMLGSNSVNNFFDGDTSNISNNPLLIDSKSKTSRPSSNRNMQQPFLFNCDSLSSSQSISNFSFAGGRSGTSAVRPVNNDDKSLSFSGHFSKIKSNTTPTTFPQSQYPVNVTNTTAISLIEDDDVVLVNSSRSHSPFMNMTTIAASTDPTPLELLVKESMRPVTTNIVVPIVAEPITKAAPKKRGRKKGSKGIDSQLHLQNNSSNNPSTSAGTGGHEINSYLDMKHKIEHMLPKSKKLKTTQELYAELQNKSKAASASTSTQVSPSSSSEQSLSTVVDSVASRMATPEPTSQDLSSTPHETTTSKSSKPVTHNNVQPVVTQPKHNIDDEIQMLMAQLPAIDFKAASDAVTDTLKYEEQEKCLCTMREIQPEIQPEEEVGEEEFVEVPSTFTTPNEVVVPVAKKEVEKPRIKPQKNVKSIFDLDYDDDNEPPIHDYSNKESSQNIPQVDIVADIAFTVVKEEEHGVKFEITVPLPQAPAVSPKLTPTDVNTSITASEPELTNLIVLPPVVQIEYDIHPECPAMKKFETNPQQITNYHLRALHDRFIANVNGNWNNLPPTDSAIKEESVTAATVKEEKIEESSSLETTEDTLCDRVVPLYNFLHYEPIPKSHSGLIEPFNHHNIKLKLLKRELLYKKQKEVAQIREKKRRKTLRREARKNNIISDDKSPLVSRKRKFNRSTSGDNDFSTELASVNKRIKLENVPAPPDATSIVPVNEDFLMKTESSSDEETNQNSDAQMSKMPIDNQSNVKENNDTVNGSAVVELKAENLDDNQSDDEKQKNNSTDSKEDDVKRQKLKEIQQSIALSSFLDNNYEYYYNNNNIMNDQQSAIACHQSSQMENNIEVAVPLKNNLNIRNNNNNNESDDGNLRKNRMLMMTIDDDVDIQNANFFNNKLASNYHQQDFAFSGNSDSLINNKNNFNDGYSNDEYNTNATYNQVCENNLNTENGTSDQNNTNDYISQEAKTSNINLFELNYENIDDKTLIQNIGSELIHNETHTKHVNPDIKMLVTSKSSQYDENYIPLCSVALTSDEELEELERALTPELPDLNNRLLSSFNDIDFDVPSSLSAIKIEPDLDGQTGLGSTEMSPTKSNVDNRQFREWHEVLNVRSYNEELLTILPYVVID